MATSVKQLVEAANAAVPRISPAAAKSLMESGSAVVIDVRDAPEIEQNGRIPGAKHVPRGMLEFRADPQSPYHDKAFDRSKTIILYCASGGRSALGGKVLQDMGYRDVHNLGGIKDWTDCGEVLELPQPGNGPR
jgi:rhodanese-related sulfurtransferase